MDPSGTAAARRAGGRPSHRCGAHPTRLHALATRLSIFLPLFMVALAWKESSRVFGFGAREEDLSEDSFCNNTCVVFDALTFTVNQVRT